MTAAYRIALGAKNKSTNKLRALTNNNPKLGIKAKLKEHNMPVRKSKAKSGMVSFHSYKRNI
jgi:hypothetical protein